MSNGDDLQSAGLSAKEMLRDVWTDVRVIRPQVDILVSANLPSRVKALEDRNMKEDAASGERGRLLILGNRSFIVIFGVVQMVAGIVGLLIATGRIKVG